MLMIHFSKVNAMLIFTGFHCWFIQYSYCSDIIHYYLHAHCSKMLKTKCGWQFNLFLERQFNLDPAGVGELYLKENLTK